VFAQVLDGADGLAVGWNASDADPGLDEGDVDLSCATAGGDVRCWGDNRSGQLGQGGVTRSVEPLAIAAVAGTSLVAGAAHACAIAGGAARCWGSRESGQIDGVEVGAGAPCTAAVCDAGAPIVVADGATELVAGARHTCGRFGDALACWGDNRSGQVGLAPSGALSPTLIAGGWSRLLGAGPRGTCAAGSSGAHCWGEVLAGGRPHREPALDGATGLGLADGAGCALLGGGALACFGDARLFGHGDPGACGDGACNALETAATCPADCGPPPLTHLARDYQAISFGAEFGCGLTAGGTVSCWGDNFYGQTAEPTGDTSPIPYTVPVTGCTRIATGAVHACALCGGALRCWGDASHGELGAPVTRVSVTEPRTILAPEGVWLDIAAGDGFTCGLTATRGYCWGTSLHGALGNGTGANLPVTVRY
jgi:hypothetical protein